MDVLEQFFSCFITPETSDCPHPISFCCLRSGKVSCPQKLRLSPISRLWGKLLFSSQLLFSSISSFASCHDGFFDKQQNSHEKSSIQSSPSFQDYLSSFNNDNIVSH